MTLQDIQYIYIAIKFQGMQISRIPQIQQICDYIFEDCLPVKTFADFMHVLLSHVFADVLQSTLIQRVHICLMYQNFPQSDISHSTTMAIQNDLNSGSV